MSERRAAKLSFDQGRFDALQIALVTLLKMQSESVQNTFCTRYKKNIETWDDATLALPISEEWRQGLVATAAHIQSILAKK